MKASVLLLLLSLSAVAFCANEIKREWKAIFYRTIRKLTLLVSVIVMYEFSTKKLNLFHAANVQLKFVVGRIS